MSECRWLRPVLVGQFEFVEWTEDAHSAAQSVYRTARGQEGEECRAGKGFVTIVGTEAIFSAAQFDQPNEF